MLKQTYKQDMDVDTAKHEKEEKMKMSLAPVKKAWTPQKGIPDQMKVKNIGVGIGGEMKPMVKKTMMMKAVRKGRSTSTGYMTR